MGERLDVMNTCVTRNTKVGNSIPVAKKTDHMSLFIDTSFNDGHSALKRRVYNNLIIYIIRRLKIEGERIARCTCEV